MKVSDRKQSYTYPPIYSLGKVVALVIFIVGLIGLPWSLVQLLRINFTEMSKSFWVQVILVLGFLFAFAGGGIGANNPPEIRVQPDGLVVEVFLLAHRFIPWCHIVDTCHRSLGLSRIPYADVVVRSGLTLWHAIYALMIGYPGKQAFFIHQDIQGYLQLLETIEHHLKRDEG